MDEISVDPPPREPARRLAALFPLARKRPYGLGAGAFGPIAATIACSTAIGAQERMGVGSRSEARPIDREWVVAVAQAYGPREGMRLLDTLEKLGDLPGYHLLPAARAQLLDRLSRWSEAADAYRCALTLVTNDAERRFLKHRLARIRKSD